MNKSMTIKQFVAHVRKFNPSISIPVMVSKDDWHFMDIEQDSFLRSLQERFTSNERICFDYDPEHPEFTIWIHTPEYKG